MPKDKSKASYALRLAGLLSLTVLWAGIAAAENVKGCAYPTAEVNIDDLNKTGLADGQHVVGEAQTPRGKLEVRVNVKKKVISDPFFVIDGKQLKRTSYSKVPKDILACLSDRKTIAYQQTAFAGPLQQLYSFSPKSEVVWRGACRFKTSCNQNICCALAICGSGRAVDCQGF